MSFSEAVRAALGDRLRELGFRCVEHFWASEDYCAFVRRVDNEVATYVICRDNRRRGGNAEVSLWVAPLQFPDDRVECLGLGARVPVLSQYQIDDALMDAVARKIEAYSHCIDSLADAVRAEIRQPFTNNQRIEVYTVARELYGVLSSTPNTNLKRAFRKVRQDAGACASGRLDFDTVIRRCEALVVRATEQLKLSDRASELPAERQGRLLAEMLVANVLIS